jgi:hypothetical protein
MRCSVPRGTARYQGRASPVRHGSDLVIALLASLAAAVLLAGCAYVCATAWADLMVWLAGGDEPVERRPW